MRRVGRDIAGGQEGAACVHGEPVQCGGDGWLNKAYLLWWQGGQNSALGWRPALVSGMSKGDCKKWGDIT